jgi:hypothetical protein
MRAIRIGSVCGLVACVVAAALAVGAAAAPPEMGRCVAQTGGKYTTSLCITAAKGKTKGGFEWEPGAVKNKFTGVGGVGTLETVGRAIVKCKTEASEGEYTSPQTVGNVGVTFTGCESGGYKCSTSHAKEGEIVTNLLSGTLVWEKYGSKVAIDLVPQSTELFVEFECGPANVKVKGSVLTNIPANVVKTTFEEKFKATKGKQKPEFYYTSKTEKVKDVLSSKIGPTEFEQAGQTITNTQTDEEALEVNTKV